MLRREFLLGEEKRKSLFSKKEAVAKNWDEGALRCRDRGFQYPDNGSRGDEFEAKSSKGCIDQ